MEIACGAVAGQSRRPLLNVAGLFRIEERSLAPMTGNDRNGGGKRSTQAGEQDHAARAAVRFGQLLAKRNSLITAAGGRRPR
jgi:hypothetical protein